MYNEILKAEKADGYLVLNNSDIRYFSGIVSSNIALLITGKESFVFSDGRYKYRIEAQNKFTPVVCKSSAVLAAVEKIKELGLKCVLCSPEDFSHKLYLECFKDVSDKLLFKSFVTKEFRAVKRKDEIENIIKAQRIAETSLKEIFPLIKEGVTTAEIQAKLDYAMNIKGSEEPAFPTIVLTGEKTNDCHGVPDNTKISENQFILFDFGATVNGYRSDMTRTVVYKEPDSYMEKIYNIVLAAHEKAAEFIKDGVWASEADACARDYITNQGYGAFFLHSLGHGVGLDIHEYPTLSPKSDAVLKEGMAVTVEPGIYLENKFGIRIEDTYIVEKNGCKSIALMEKSLIKLK